MLKKKSSFEDHPPTIRHSYRTLKKLSVVAQYSAVVSMLNAHFQYRSYRSQQGCLRPRDQHDGVARLISEPKSLEPIKMQATSSLIASFSARHICPLLLFSSRLERISPPWLFFTCQAWMLSMSTRLKRLIGCLFQSGINQRSHQIGKLRQPASVQLGKDGFSI